jgi:hypothetical protein
VTHELKITLSEIQDDAVRLTLSADLSRLPAWRMFVDGLEGLHGVELALVSRYSVELGLATWISTVEELAAAISEEFYAGVIVGQLLSQPAIASVTYTDEILGTNRQWESNDGHEH